MNADVSAKQQIVEKIRGSSNILVTVSTDPSVDELSAALALTLLLNKLKKHATAVVSGAIPAAINFLEPDKTFENTVDSLRDFIIALDKEKADHLRYKVDGDVVKIFITPYKTTISEQDLDFSQGDYNVELVLALGVHSREHLDTALAAHGRILHDATVATIGNGEASKLGGIDWQDADASSLCEMLISLSESLKDDKSVLDEQIATALLTGIVAATDRFSNNLTSSRVMTMAAQLMAAGANQQLIAAKLEEADEISGPLPPAGPAASDDNPATRSDGTTDLAEGEPTKLSRAPKEPKQKQKRADGDLKIDHPEEETPAEPAPAAVATPPSAAVDTSEDELSRHLAHEQQPAKILSVADLQADLASASAEIDEDAAKGPADPSDDMPGVDYVELPAPQPALSPAKGVSVTGSEPAFGGTLNATTEAAAEAKRQAQEDDRNRTILTHDNRRYISEPPTTQAPINAASAEEEKPLIDIFAAPPQDAAPAMPAAPIAPPAEPAAPPPLTPPLPSAPADPTDSILGMPDADSGIESQTLAEIDSQNRASKGPDDARAAVEAAFNTAPFDPAGNPAPSIGAQQLGNITHDTPLSGAVPFTPAPPMLPPAPPMPDFSTLPPLPPQPGFDQPPAAPGAEPTFGDIFGNSEASPPAPSAPSDPGQFRIPGQ